MQITDNALEESFFTAGDNLGNAATTQFDLVPVAVEDRRRRLKALALTIVIFCVAILLLGLVLPGPTDDPGQRQNDPPDQSATL